MDEEKMKVHLAVCQALLTEKRRLCVKWKRPLKPMPNGLPPTVEQQAALNKVFDAALTMLAEDREHDGGGAEADGRSTAVRHLSRAFSSALELMDGRGWLPLHWAMVAAAGELHGVTEADVKAIYDTDPLALHRHHVVLPSNLRADDYDIGFTPSHLLCMFETTERTKSLVRFYSVLSQQSFTMKAARGYDGGALHIACRFGKPSEWLLQHLMQMDLDASAVSDQRYTPLGALCEHSSHVDGRVLDCLLAADSSSKVVIDAARRCLSSKVLTNRVETLKALLTANPSVATVTSPALAHLACLSSGHMPAQECVDILKLLVTAHRDAFTQEDDGELPIHYLAQYGPVEALEYLLGACPETAEMLSVSSENLLHYVATYPMLPHAANEVDKAAKVRFLTRLEMRLA